MYFLENFNNVVKQILLWILKQWGNSDGKHLEVWLIQTILVSNTMLFEWGN